MKNSVKKSTVVLCICMIALLSCACSNDDSQSPEGASLENNVLTENTVSAENTEPEITEQGTEPQTEAAITEVTEFERLKVTIEESLIEETDDVKTAKDFLIAYMCRKLNQEKTDLSEYTDNEYLETYFENDIRPPEDTFENFGRQWSSREIVLFPMEMIEKDGVKYIRFKLNFVGGIGGYPTVAIRDGKVVNANTVFFPLVYGYLWCDDITQMMDYNGYDIWDYPNPWDDEEIAERLVKAQGLYDNHHGEYEFFKDAWNSLGE